MHRRHVRQSSTGYIFVSAMNKEQAAAKVRRRYKLTKTFSYTVKAVTLSTYKKKPYVVEVRRKRRV